MDANSLEEEQASIELDILKLQLHSVPLNLNWGGNEDEEEEEEEDEEGGLDEEYLLSAIEDPDQPSTSGINYPPQTMTTLTTVSAVDSEDEDDVVQSEPEEEVIDLSADLSATPENLLKLNIAYQEVIQQQIHSVEELLHHNSCKQMELDADMDEDTADMNSKKTKPKADLGLCVAPYFRALSTVGPPSHSDVLRRFEEVGHNFIVNALPPPSWKAKMEKALMAAVERDAVRVRTEPLMANIEYLEDKYRISEDPEIAKKIEDARMKLAEAKEAKKSTLHGKRFDDHDWSTISNIGLEGEKSAIECSIYWNNHLHPDINKGSWTNAEDERLKKLAKKYRDHNWKAVAAELNTGRTALQCIQRYQRKHNVTHKKKPWTPEEDAKLKALMETYRVGDAIPYTLVALKLKSRNSTQVVHRWTKSVNPKYKKNRWTAEEDIMLLQGIAKHGKRWALLRDREVVPGRNDAQMRERYQNVLCNITRGPFSADEDLQLTQLIEKYGAGNWAAIARELPGRTDSQVMKRWQYLNTLKENGHEVEYRVKKDLTMHRGGLTQIRQKLMDTLQEEMKKNKESKEKAKKNPPGQQETVPRPAANLPKDQKVKFTDLKQYCDPHLFDKRLMEKLKEDISSEEVSKLYQHLTKKKERKEKRWNRQDGALNLEILKLIGTRYKPYQAEGVKKGTNLNIIKEKVLQTAKTISARVIFIHYIKAMNIDAERTLTQIKTHSEKNEKNFPTTSQSQQKHNGKEDIEQETSGVSGSEGQRRKTAFKRNYFLPLCAPNRATVRAYRDLMRARDSRVKTAMTILHPRKNTPFSADSNSESTMSESDAGRREAERQQAEGESSTRKYTPEQLIKNIQLSQQHKMFRSRFVALFAWPTILSTLVPYQRVGFDGNMRPVVRILKKNSENLGEQIPIKRRKLQNGTSLNTVNEEQDGKRRSHEF